MISFRKCKSENKARSDKQEQPGRLAHISSIVGPFCAPCSSTHPFLIAIPIQTVKSNEL